MIEIKTFKFQTNVSLDTYQSKTDAIACLSSKGSKAIGKEKMAFKVQTITVDEFLLLATSGHTFCNLFKYDSAKKYWFQQDKTGRWFLEFPEYKTGINKGGMKLCMKSDKFFAGSQTIFVDVDYTKYDNISDYISTLTYKPTAVYMSFSDNIEKHGITSRRFRLVYVFDHVLNKDEFRHVSQSINDKIVFDTSEPMDDDCGTRMSQYMNGVWGNDETYASYLIYSVSDFPEEQPEDLITISEDIAQQGIVFDEKMLRDMGDYTVTQFLHYYSWKYPYQYRTEKAEWTDDIYQMTDENYLQLWWYKEKVKDGQHRRRKLFKNACLRRIMFPDMTPDAALYNLYLDFVRFFDFSDGEITLDCLVRKVRNAFEKTTEQLIAYCDKEIRYWREHRHQFILKPGIVCNWGLIADIKKRINWKRISEIYDPSVSLQQNLKNGVGVPQSTLYRYCKSNNINTNPNKEETKMEKRNEKRLDKQQKIEQFRKLYDPNDSIEENKYHMEVLGLELSKSTICRWAHKYYEVPDTPALNNEFDFQPVVEEKTDDKNVETKEEESYSFSKLFGSNLWCPPSTWGIPENDNHDYDVDVIEEVENEEISGDGLFLEGYSWCPSGSWHLPDFSFGQQNKL